jgi:hypothetical protein
VAPRRGNRAIGIFLIVLGALACSLFVLAAFTPIGLVSVPVGVALIAFGASRLNRADNHIPPEPLSWAVEPNDATDSPK